MKALRKIFIIFVAVLMAIAGGKLYTVWTQPYPMGSAAEAILRSATSVTAYKVTMRTISLASFTKSDEPQVDGFLVTDSGYPQGKEFLSELQNDLLHYGPVLDSTNKCFGPDCMFHVVSPHGTLNILPCFTCNGIETAAFDPRGHEISEQLTYLDRRASFLKLAKEAFPKDPDFKSL